MRRQVAFHPGRNATDERNDGFRCTPAPQRNPGRPETGWNGGIDAGDDGTALLGLTYNNVQNDSLERALGWAEVCEKYPG